MDCSKKIALTFLLLNVLKLSVFIKHTICTLFSCVGGPQSVEEC